MSAHGRHSRADISPVCRLSFIEDRWEHMGHLEEARSRNCEELSSRRRPPERQDSVLENFGKVRVVADAHGHDT